jgi:hypothetical protein
VLGAIVGAGVLAAVGAVGAWSSPERHADTVPRAVFDDLKFMDQQLTKAIAEAGKGESVGHRVDTIKKTKLELVDGELNLPVDGVQARVWFRTLDCVDVEIALAKRIEDFGVGTGHANVQIPRYLKAAQRCKETLEKALTKANQPEKVSITESDTWAHNEAIGKSNICINVKTTPPQAFISAELAGPGNYTANLPKTPLHPDGTRQVGATVTQAGAYTDTLNVYDKNGKQTASTTNTITVAPPPQNGPDPTFGPSCPAPTK